uniref:Uncharacterized protein n=1 Tax=Anguilla anguilla TaxID=7936 RepID=A0A0E9W7Z6_ANGAN
MWPSSCTVNQNSTNKRESYYAIEVYVSIPYARMYTVVLISPLLCSLVAHNAYVSSRDLTNWHSLRFETAHIIQGKSALSFLLITYLSNPEWKLSRAADGCNSEYYQVSSAETEEGRGSRTGLLH